MLQKTGGNEAI